MEYYITTFIAFVTGGGVTAVLSIRYARKTTKLDYADKAMKFMESVNDEMGKRYDELGKRYDELGQRVKNLEDSSCINFDCNERIKAG